jgi:hypothetical protein
MLRRSSTALLAATALALFMVCSVLVLRLNVHVANAYVQEDGPVEDIGAFALAVGAVLAFVAFRRAGREPARDRAAQVRRLSYLGLALFLLVAFGEEISWGQRILGLGTPDVLRSANAQGEMNLHNLHGDANGQNASDVLFKAVWVTLGVIVPVAAAVSARARATLERFVPVLPLWLALLFVGQQLLWKPATADWRHEPAAWHAVYRAQIAGDDFRVTTQRQAHEHRVNAPAGLSEVMETNVEVLLGVAGLMTLLGAGSGPARRPSPRRSGGRTARAGRSAAHAA